MTGILAGLRIVEGSAFIAAPLGGMTLAQLGADVIRFDDIKGGLDSDRWPITKDGRSIYWAGLNKGKRSIAVDLRQSARPRASDGADHCTGRGRGHLHHQHAGARLALLRGARRRSALT